MGACCLQSLVLWHRVPSLSFARLSFFFLLLLLLDDYIHAHTYVLIRTTTILLHAYICIYICIYIYIHTQKDMYQ